MAQARAGRGLATVLLVVILAAGVAIGVALERLALHRETSPIGSPRDEAKLAERLVARFTRELKLDGDQVKKVGDLVRQSRAEIGQIRARVEPEVQAVRVRTRAEILNVLRPEQQKRYREMIAEYEARRARQGR